MLEIIQKIKDSDLVENFTIDKFINEESVKFLKVTVLFKNKTLLFIKIFLSINQFKYSYHWQTKIGKLIRRWDNAPHGKKKRRIIDHCHVDNDIIQTKGITLDAILEQVKIYTD